jgi:hypothetical protein
MDCLNPFCERERPEYSEKLGLILYSAIKLKLNPIIGLILNVLKSLRSTDIDERVEPADKPIDI